jgi:starch synthase
MPGLLGLGANLVLLGSGEAGLEAGFAAAAGNHPGRVGVMIGYDEALSHLIIAGSDAILVPSRFEPCGLTQLYAARYGALPVVRRTGGLADTVVDPADNPEAATGYVFEDYSAAALQTAIDRALAAYSHRPLWEAMVRRGMSCDFSWGHSARDYEALYEETLIQRRKD